MLSRARTLSLGGRGGWVSRRPQPSGKTDELAAVIQILCQFHYIDALEASPAGRYDAPPPAAPGGGKAALSRLLRATHLVFALCALATPAAVLTANLAVAQIQPGETANEPHRKVVTAVPRSWPPQYSLDENGKPIGFAIEVMDEIAARAGLTVEYVVVENISAAGQMLNRGHVDLVPNSGIVPERMGGRGHAPAAFPLRPAIPLGGRFSPFAPSTYFHRRVIHMIVFSRPPGRKRRADDAGGIVKRR